MTAQPNPDLLRRKNLCLALPEPDKVIHDSDEAFSEEVGKLYSVEESRLAESLIVLKSELKRASPDDFWSHLAEKLAEILGAQLAFISKRMLVDDQDMAVEMPPIGEPGSCLMSSALYWNDGRGSSQNNKSFRYHAYGCPCGYMRHDKVFIVPKDCNIFTPATSNPNTFPFEIDSYIGIPLFADGKSFAHFGVLWTKEGTDARKVSWANVELFLHSLEDVVQQKLLAGSTFKDVDIEILDPPLRSVIPHSAVTAAQSLKPYARSLSHELRTPMQGVVGMLDIMYATVLEATENYVNPEVRKIFETLKENIEVVQDSSRRAVEAADNVVHAYDMDMHVPETDSTAFMAGDGGNHSALRRVPSHGRPDILVAGSDLPLQRPNKRRRDEDVSTQDLPSKLQATLGSRAKRGDISEDLKQGVREAESASEARSLESELESCDMPPQSPLQDSEMIVAPGLRHTQLRNVIQYVVNEGLKIGGRPESAIAHETDFGEVIEVRTTNSTGQARTKIIEWTVEPSVPTTMFIDEKDLAKLISCLFLNAVKFTDQGRITISARMSTRSRHIVFTVADSGPGIPKAFLPKLFKPFSQEDPSLTRQSEGLGLGLLVAKGLARKLGGDLVCSRADTEGPRHGCEFEVRLPTSPADHISRPSSPVGSPIRPRRKTSSQSVEPTIGTLLPITPLTTPDGLEVALAPAEPKKFVDGLPPVHPRQAELMRKPSLPISLPPTPQPDVDVFRIPAVPSSPTSQPPTSDAKKRPSLTPRKSSASVKDVDRDLATKYPLSFLVAEDNKINRKLLVNMLTKFGYTRIHEAYDGAEAVRQMEQHRPIDVVLMDLWMPFMDGYEATEKILQMDYSAPGLNDKGKGGGSGVLPTVLAVTADVTDGALERAAKVGMKGFMTKPFKLLDLQRLIVEYCSQRATEAASAAVTATKGATMNAAVAT